MVSFFFVFNEMEWHSKYFQVPHALLGMATLAATLKFHGWPEQVFIELPVKDKVAGIFLVDIVINLPGMYSHPSIDK